jgi:pimeloyl-ACP methyl ester carboxylesterase
VLVPDPDESRPPLGLLARELAAAGPLVLALDLPAGTVPSASVAYTRAAAAFLRTRGVDKIVLIGEGAGGTAALGDAAVERVSGVATLSAPTVAQGAGGNVDGAAALARIDRPVLFMASLGDADRAAAAQRLYDAARDPRSLALLPGSARGAGMLQGQDATQSLTVLRDFLRQAYSPLSA